MLRSLHYLCIALCCVGLCLSEGTSVAHAAPESPMTPLPSAVQSQSLENSRFPGQLLSDGQCKPLPLLMAEGSNSCEIISCGMALKDTCKITCPANQNPKCSCDCMRSFGPICTDYKANCRCE